MTTQEESMPYGKSSCGSKVSKVIFRNPLPLEGESYVLQIRQLCANALIELDLPSRHIKLDPVVSRCYWPDFGPISWWGLVPH